MSYAERFCSSDLLCAFTASLAVVFVAGCISEPTGTSNQSLEPVLDRTASSEFPDEAQLAVDELARSLALALGKPTARAATIRAMRGSHYHERKLLLGEFLSTDAEQVGKIPWGEASPPPATTTVAEPSCSHSRKCHNEWPKVGGHLTQMRIAQSGLKRSSCERWS